MPPMRSDTGSWVQQRRTCVLDGSEQAEVLRSQLMQQPLCYDLILCHCRSLRRESAVRSCHRRLRAR